MYIQIRKMFFFNSILNFIKYIFFLQILYCTILTANENDFRANPEIGIENKSKSFKDISNRSMIVCADKRATLAARKILKEGGNALDAIIAAQNVLSVVEPQSSGLGGGGFLIFYNKKLNLLEAWDGREIAPKSSMPEQFLNEKKEKLSFFEAVTSNMSIGVPGLYSMLADAHAEHGILNWENLFTESLFYAKGFEVSPRLHKMLGWAPNLNNDSYAKNIYFDNENPKNVGSIIKNNKLVKTLEILSKNPYSVNNGAISKMIHNKLYPILTKEDLKSWKTIKRKPICFDYRTYDICGFPPPTSGGISVLQILGILENIKTDFNPSVSVLDEHLFLEASRLAYADRDIFIADPQFFNVPTKSLLDKRYLRNRSRLIDQKKATLKVTPGNLLGFEESKLHTGINIDFPSTTHISIVDRNGNAATLTSSIEFAFGSGKTVGGFFLNNQLTDFSFQSYRDDGSIIANSVQAKKKPRSSMAPTLVFKDNNLVGVLGSPGGSRIICYVAKTLYYLINFNINLQKVIDLPHLCSRGIKTEIEKVAEANKVANELTLMGHDITRKKMTSGLNVIWKKNNLWIGVSDYRREGFAVGY